MNVPCDQELELFLEMPLVDQVDKAGKVRLSRGLPQSQSQGSRATEALSRAWKGKFMGGEVYGRGGATRRKQQQQWEGQGRKGAEEPAGTLIPSSFPRPPARLAHLARPCNQPDYTPTASDKVCVSWLKFLRSKSQLIHFVLWAGWFL